MNKPTSKRTQDPSVRLGNRLRMAFAILLSLGLLVILDSRSLAVTVSVTQFDLLADSGEWLQESFAIVNTDNQSVELELVLVDWDRSIDGITHTLAAATLPRSCASWMALGGTAVALAPDDEINISLDIRVPEDVDGTYWAAILINARASSGSVEGGNIEQLRQFLVRVFVTILPASSGGQISNLQVRGTHPLGIDVAFTNTGNTVLWGVSGLAAVESLAGVTLFEMALAPFDVLPGHVFCQSVASLWALSIPGKYLVRAVIDYGADYLVAGQIVLRIDELNLEPLSVGLPLPADRDGDGLYEDVNGDGALTELDADLLSQRIEAPSIQNNLRAFDFNNDGDVTPIDAEFLRETVLRAIE